MFGKSNLGLDTYISKSSAKMLNLYAILPTCTPWIEGLDRKATARHPWRVLLEIFTGEDNVPLTFILADGAVYKAIIFCINSTRRPICSRDATINCQSNRSKAFSASKHRGQSSSLISEHNVSEDLSLG